MDPQKPSGSEPRQVVRYESLGYTFAFAIVLFAGAGYLIDRWLGSLPAMTIGGTLAGAALAVVWVYVRIRRDEEAAKAQRRADGTP